MVEKKHPRTVTPGGPAAIKICFFTSVASFDTGMPICTYKLIKHFSEQAGYDVHAVFPERGEFVDRLMGAAVAVSIIPFSRMRSLKRGADFFRFCIGLPVAMLRMVRFMRSERFAIVHFSDLIDAPFYLCAAVTGARVVAHVRQNLDGRAQRMLFGWWSALFVDTAVCISRAVRRSVRLSEAHVAVVYDPGPDRSLFDPLRSYPAFPALDKNKLLVVSIAKFLQVKGHEHFVRTAAAAEHKLPGRLLYVIVGGREPGHERYYEDVTGLIGRLGLKGLVVAVGQLPHEQIPALLSHTAIFAHLPNYQEGLGGVILEAMTMAVPVVVFDSGGAGECFVDGEHGFLVKHHDDNEAARKVVLLASDAALRTKMGLAAQKHVGLAFSYEKHFAGIETVYRSLVPGALTA